MLFADYKRIVMDDVLTSLTTDSFLMFQ